jgi:hypothetical protein
MVSYPSGTTEYVEITGQSGGNITIQPGLSTACSSAQANSMLVSFALLGRFANDNLQMDYETETIANITSEFKSVFYPLDTGLPSLWQDAYSYSTWQGTSYGWTNYNMRVVIPAAELSGSGSGVRITLGYYDTDYDIAALYIGHQATSGDTIDFDGNQTQVTFNAGSGSATVSTGGLESDIITFNFDGTKNLVFSMYFSTANADVPSSARASYAGEVWYYGAANEASSTDVDASTNYTDYSSTENIDVIEKIEIYAG